MEPDPKASEARPRPDPETGRTGGKAGEPERSRRRRSARNPKSEESTESARDPESEETTGAAPDPQVGGSASSGAPPPATAREALERARDHTRTAAAELAAALRALLDAAALAATGAPSDRGVLAPLAEGLDQLRALVDPHAARDGDAVLQALAGALDAEIARWEERSRDDADARSVLRAFLGVRELLWELGVRRAHDDAGGETEGTQERPRKRLQRIPVEG